MLLELKQTLPIEYWADYLAHNNCSKNISKYSIPSQVYKSEINVLALSAMNVVNFSDAQSYSNADIKEYVDSA